jgi:hypothetical protein
MPELLLGMRERNVAGGRRPRLDADRLRIAECERPGFLRVAVDRDDEANSVSHELAPEEIVATIMVQQPGFLKTIGGSRIAAATAAPPAEVTDIGGRGGLRA